MKCEACGQDAHRDDAMNRRCNGCEHLVRQCDCADSVDPLVVHKDGKLILTTVRAYVTSKEEYQGNAFCRRPECACGGTRLDG